MKTPIGANDGKSSGRHETADSAPMSQIRYVLNMLVARTFAVRESDLLAKTRCRAQTAFARQVAMYLAHTSFGLSLTEVGALFERDRTTVAHGCALIEDRRDMPWLDQTLAILDQSLRLCCRATNRCREDA